jgi:hypothetical protein
MDMSLTMDQLRMFVPKVTFELIPINSLVSNQDYQRKLSKRHINRTVANFDWRQINPVKVSRRDGNNYVMNGQHTIEVIAAASGSRETPVWCMVFDDMAYLEEAEIFAEQQKYTKRLSPYEIFMANVEADSDNHLVVKSIVEQCGLKLALSSKTNGRICAVSALLEIYEKNGYEGLTRTIKLVIKTWEGDVHSLTANMLRGVALLIATYGDSLHDDLFAERIGSTSAREITRTARDRRAGSIGFAEAMLLLYNKKTRSTLSMNRLHSTDKQKEGMPE